MGSTCEVAGSKSPMSAPIIDVKVVLTLAIAAIVGVGTGILGYAIGRLVTPFEYSHAKVKRYEAGNPPTGRARGWFSMQYYAYLIIFLTVEPILVYSFLFLMEAHLLFHDVVRLFLLILGLLIPPLIFGLDAARRVKLWIVREE